MKDMPYTEYQVMGEVNNSTSRVISTVSPKVLKECVMTNETI